MSSSCPPSTASIVLCRIALIVAWLKWGLIKLEREREGVRRCLLPCPLLPPACSCPPRAPPGVLPPTPCNPAHPKDPTHLSWRSASKARARLRGRSLKHSKWPRIFWKRAEEESQLLPGVSRGQLQPQTPAPLCPSLPMGVPHTTHHSPEWLWLSPPWSTSGFGAP